MINTCFLESTRMVGRSRTHAGKNEWARIFEQREVEIWVEISAGLRLTYDYDL